MPMTLDRLEQALNRIDRAAEARSNASASAVEKRKKEEEEKRRAQSRQAEAAAPYAEAARRAPAIHGPSKANLYSQAAQKAASPYAMFGQGNAPMDAQQGRELMQQQKKNRQAQLDRELERIEEEARQGREQMEQAGKRYDARMEREQERHLYSKAAQEKGRRDEGAATYAEEEDAPQKLYSQRQKAQQDARTGFWDSAMRMVGAGLEAQEAPYASAADQAERARQMQENYRQAAERQRQSRELAKAEDWEGREDMIARYRDLQGQLQEIETMVGMGFEAPTDYAELVREMNSLRSELERRDTLAGNGARSYSGEDRVGNVLTGTGQNIAAGIVNAGATAGEGYAREEALRENIAPSDYVLRQMAKGDLTEWNAMRQRTVDQEAIHEQFLPVYEAADSLSENAQRDLQKAKEGLGVLGQAGVDIAENMMEMGFDAGVGAVSGGGSLGSMFVRVLGQSAMEARQNGATLEQQLAYGLTSAAIEILTEKIADGVAGIYGAGAADDITEELIRKLAETDTGRSAMRLLIAGISEGGEEVLSDLLSPLAQAMYRTDEMGNRLTVGQLYGEIDPADVLHSFIMGAAVGWLSSAGGAVTGSNAGPNAELRLRDTLEPMARQAAQSAEIRAAWEAATGEKLSKNEGSAARQMLDYEAERVGSGEAGVLEGLLKNENAPAGAEAVERAQNENATAGTAETEVSAAQTGAEGAQIENGNAQIDNENAQIENENAQTNNGNAQTAEEGGQTAEKPDLYAVQEKAARGLDKLTDAELEVYTEYMQRQVAMSGGLPGYTEKTRNMLREGLADAQAEAQRRTEAAAATEASGTQEEQGGSQAEQGEYTGDSGTKYSKEQADALSKLSSDTLIGGAEAQFTMPIDRLGITEEQADALRKAGLLATETQEDGDTFEYLPDVYIFDERSRRRNQWRNEREQRAAGEGVRGQEAQGQQPAAGNENAPAGAEANTAETAQGAKGDRYTAEAEDGEYEVLKGPNGDFIVKRLADGRAGDPTGNIYILANSIPMLENIEPVSAVKGNEIPNTEKSGSANILKFFSSIGNKVFRTGLGEVLLDRYGAKATAVREHHPTRLKFMAVAAVPDVIQKGRLIHSEIHNGKQSYTFAAPVTILGKPVYMAAIVHEVIQDGRPTNKYYLDEIVDLDGYRINVEEKKAPVSPKYGATTKSGATETPTVLSENSIPSTAENSNPQNEGGDSQAQESAENGTEASGELETRENPARREAREANGAMADELADGSWSSVEPGKAIDIMPGEGEEAVSSANGLTEEDNRRLDTYINAADLFGPTNAEKEKTATEKAAKSGNDALREFAETMPEDPMDLYAERNPVTTKAENKYHRGQEKITNEKAGERKTLLQKASDAWHAFLRSMVNEGDSIHQIGRKTGNRAIDGMYFYAKAATMRAQQWVQKQRTSFDTRTSGKGLNEIFDPIRAKGDRYYQNFQLYLYHMLNVERMSRAFGTELEEAQALVDQLASANPSIAAMTDETLAAKARQYEEGGGLGYLENETQGELIYEYWKAKQELRRAEKARNKPVFDYDLDADESQKIARDLLAANPEFEKLAQEVYDYVDALLQYRVDAGLITQADAENLKKTYPHYVPVMYEISEEGDDKIRKGNVNVSSTVKKAKGGNHRMLPLHYALARQTLAVMRNAGYQQLGTAVLNEFEQNQGIMDRYVSNVEENDAVWDEAMADNDDVNVPYENVISVFRGGKRYDLTLSDDLSFAFKSLQSGKNGPQDLKAAVAANNLFKKLCTAYNPLFMITNPIRDVQDALFYSTDTKRWIRNYPKAIAQISGGGNYWKMYQSLGGVQNSYFDWATGETAGKMGKVEALNLAIEQAPRLAEFMTVLENAKRNNGGEFTQADLMEAFNAAAEVTTNFARGGTMGKWINRNLVPFWNPGVQGFSKAVRTATEAKSFKAWAGLALKAAALGMLPELLNGLLYRDDDEWDVIDDQMKMDYYLFKTSDGVWIKIPKGRMLAALSMPVVGAQEAMRGDDVDWGELTRSAFGSIAPNNPFESNLLRTARQAQLFDPDDPGKTWYGGNIESRRLQSYAPGERYDESTDAISKWLGGKLGISPKKINYVIDQYSGVLGDLVLPYLTPKAERGLYLGDSGVAVPFSNAFMSRFTTDTVTSNTISNEYYGLLDELGYNAKDGDKPSAIAERYMNRAGGQVTEFYAKIREIENDPKLTDAEKSKLTRELRKQLNEYEQQVTEDAGKYLEAAQKYMDEHPEYDYSDDDIVDAFVEGYNSQQTSEKYYIDADQARSKMKDEVYREVNREHFGAEYALQTYSKDVYEKAKAAHEESGVSYEDYYDFYFGKRYLFADKDEEGKSIAGSKKEKVVELIDNMDIPDEQKDELYLSAGYNESSLADAPWNNGSGIYTGSGSGKKISVPKGHEATYKKVVDSNLTALKGTAAYKAADEKGQKALTEKLQDYATVQAMKEADPEYSPAGTSYGWTVWADTAQKTGLSLPSAIEHMTAIDAIKADYDEYGKAVSGSKKQKVCEYINALDLTDEQKDVLFLYEYAKSGLKYTPWHGYKKGRGRYSRRRSAGGKKLKAYKRTISPGIDVSALFGGGTSSGKSIGKQTGDASRDLLDIVNRYYGGDAFAAAMDGGRAARGKTKVDFKL